MISRFFIDRPIFAAVLSILITLAGALAVLRLPVAQFPRVSPPVVSVQCTYPGASAQTVAEAVAAPIEQEVNGVEGMMYMNSSCTNDGGYSLTVTFHQGIDLDMAQVLVQNRVALAIPKLPDVIKQTTVIVRKRSPDPLMGFAIVSPKGTRDQLFLSNYALRVVKEEMARVPGVSDINILAQRDYSMRIWVNPNRLSVRGLTASDLIAVLREQNQQAIPGTIGQEPQPAGQEYALTMDARGRLDDVEQFQNIILRSTPDGRLVRLKDVARVELAPRNQEINVKFNRNPAAFLVLFQLPDANALDLHARILARMDELRADFPDDVEARVAFDTTPYTAESIQRVLETLRDAIILVAVVVLLFLQNWRSAIIPLAAVPVGIVGTFAVLLAFGFSLNNLTLFGLVLAIGIVVDDAIVVVEAVEHHIEEGKTPYDATLLAMKQVSGPVVAVGLVLSAVFIPCAFISGITGMFFRQFALTIAAGTLISTFNSLTLSPALAALLLRKHPAKGGGAPPLPRVGYVLVGALLGVYFGEFFGHGWWGFDGLPWAARAAAGGVVGLALSWPINGVLRLVFWGFNGLFGLARSAYVWTVGMSLRAVALVLVAYLALLAVTAERIGATPKGFIPTQDMGYMMVSVQLPDSASLERTQDAMNRLAEIAHNIPGVRHVTTIAGMSFALGASGSNFGSMFLNLHEYADRADKALYSEAIANQMRFRSLAVHDAAVAVFSPPPIRGIGRAGGFSFVVEDRADLGPEALQREVDNLIAKVRGLPKEALEAGEKAIRVKNRHLPPDEVEKLVADFLAANKGVPGLANPFTVYRANVPQLRVVANLDQCQMRGVAITDFTDTLRVFEGSLYVNDFNLFGRTWQVVLQAEGSFRDQPEDIKRLKVRNATGGMVQIGSIADVKEVNGPLVLNRYNMYPAAQITGFAAPGVSSRDAIALMEEVGKKELPIGMAYEWTDMSYLELQAGNTAYQLFAFAVAMVFLVLAAQYESWAFPLAVILVVPLCILSATLGVNALNLDINIFTQVGFVVLAGLASKNAILIVEYAKHLREDHGVERRQATLEACKLRLRPIVMTSLAFILGVLPLVIAHGAGAEMRKALGIAVFAGMIGVTVFGLLFTPTFFYVIDWLSGLRSLNTPAVLRYSGLALDWLTLGPVRRSVAEAWHSLRGSAEDEDGVTK